MFPTFIKCRKHTYKKKLVLCPGSIQGSGGEASNIRGDCPDVFKNMGDIQMNVITEIAREIRIGSRYIYS